MLDTSFPPATIVTSAIAFAIGAIFCLAGPAFAQRVREHRNGQPDFHRGTGLTGLLGAIVWAMPQTRGWGAAIADPAALRAMLSLLTHRLRHLCALLGFVPALVQTLVTPAAARTRQCREEEQRRKRP